MRSTVNKEEAYKLMIDLAKTYTDGDLMVETGKSFQTVYAWKTGKRTPMKGDFELLKRMLERR